MVAASMAADGGEDRLVTPGEVLGKAADFLPGRGTYLSPHNQTLYASLSGRLRLVPAPPSSPHQVCMLPTSFLRLWRTKGTWNTCLCLFLCRKPLLRSLVTRRMALSPSPAPSSLHGYKLCAFYLACISEETVYLICTICVMWILVMWILSFLYYSVHFVR